MSDLEKEEEDESYTSTSYASYERKNLSLECCESASPSSSEKNFSQELREPEHWEATMKFHIFHIIFRVFKPLFMFFPCFSLSLSRLLFIFNAFSDIFSPRKMNGAVNRPRSSRCKPGGRIDQVGAGARAFEGCPEQRFITDFSDFFMDFEFFSLNAFY